jgi:pimeloyl-ACP methyl ester carboxylesterase
MDNKKKMVDVPGARLRYCLAGTSGAPLLVFENGWGASYEQWFWMERELAAHAQLLFYNRAGIGGSELLAPQTVAGLSDQFAALPAALGLAKPVVAIGHSYGGLMCSLHAAQRGDVLKSLVEIDPTSEVAEPVLDANLQTLIPALRLVKICLALGLPNFLFGGLGKSLPPAQGAEIMRRALSNPASLDAGLVEFKFLNDIRSAISSGHPAGLSRLLIGAGATSEASAGVIGKWISGSKRMKEAFERSKAAQRERAVRDPKCEMTLLPFTHGGLVFDQAGAKESAAVILKFLRQTGS